MHQNNLEAGRFQDSGAHMDVQLAVGGFVEDAWVALHGPLVQGEGNLWESVQVQARLSQHQRQHLRAHAHTDESSSGHSVSCMMGHIFRCAKRQRQ